jgi:hypothetical protein
LKRRGYVLRVLFNSPEVARRVGESALLAGVVEEVRRTLAFLQRVAEGEVREENCWIVEFYVKEEMLKDAIEKVYSLVPHRHFAVEIFEYDELHLAKGGNWDEGFH